MSHPDDGVGIVDGTTSGGGVEVPPPGWAMSLSTVLCVLFVLCYLCYQYINYFLSVLLARCLRCRNVRLENLTFRSLGRLQLNFDEYDVELEEITISSNLRNLEPTKPLSLAVREVRIERKSPLNERPRSANSAESSTTSQSHRKLTQILQWLQYLKVNVVTAHIVLLDYIPDCLFHITLKGLCLDTFRDRDGLQLELQFDLLQPKLFLRNPPKKASEMALALVDIQLAGRASLDVVERSGRIKQFGLQLHNTRIRVCDVLFDYLLLHSPKPPNPADLTVDSDAELGNSPTPTPPLPHKPTIVRLLDRLPDVRIGLENFAFEFDAILSPASTRTLSATWQRIHANFGAKEREGEARFGELLIRDHQSASQFRCEQFVVALKRAPPSTNDDSLLSAAAESGNSTVKVRVVQPKLELFKHDLAWWMDYVRAQPLDDVAAVLRRRFGTAKPARADSPQIPDHAQQHNSPTLIFHVVLLDVQCLLRIRDGPVVVVGVEMADLKADHHFRSVDFGVESLWCHRGGADFSGGLSALSFAQHNWGTTVAIGAGCAQITHPRRGRCNVYVQLDECQFEWEAAVVKHLVEYVRLFQPRAADNGETEMSSENAATELQLQIAAKKLSLFFTARGAAFIVATTESFRLDLARTPNHPLAALITFERIRLGTAPLNNRFPLACDWWSKPASEVAESGGCQKLRVRFAGAPNPKLVIEADNSVELQWSPLAYAVLYDVISRIRETIRSLTPPPAAASTPTEPKQPMEFHIRTDHQIVLEFQLPRDHLMRWVVPSLVVEYRGAARFLIAAPMFLLEMDSHMIMTLENPRIERQPMIAVMDLARADFKKRSNRTNKVWTWSTDELSILFPYKYDFAAAFDEIINSVKWMKKLHGVQRKPFTAESPLPADLNFIIKEASLSMDDDPFENQLQIIYETSMDEIYERERRRQMLEQKLEQLEREGVAISKTKAEALRQSLVPKDADIYVERIRMARREPRRHLLSWKLKNFNLKAFADLSLHGKENVVKCIRQFNAESAFPADGMDFSTLWARDVVLDVAESRMQFRDYPLPYQHIVDCHFWGTVCGAEHLAGPRSTRECYVELPQPWGLFELERNMCPLKFYYDLECETKDLRMTYGPCWEPCLSMISLCWRWINSPSRDPSPPLAFWDKIRLLVHGRLLMFTQKLVTSMLASPDPYNETELIEISWENFEFEWLTGEFRIRTNLGAFVRTASKYDDSRLLHLPQLKFFIRLNWVCLADQHDHHSVHPIAPNKLPDYVTVGGHDSYRAFRSEHLDLVLQFEVKPPADGATAANYPQILLYANTFKWLDFMKNTLTMQNRPVKRGAVFNEEPTRRQQLSRHLKNIQLNVTLPRFLISYWMSFTSSYGFRMMSDGLRLTSSMVLNTAPVEMGDGVRRRPKTAWKISHVSVQLENTQIHLYGDTRQPTANQTQSDDSDESFFIGLSRLNYVRESKSNHPLNGTPKPQHKRTASYSAKNGNPAAANGDPNSSSSARADPPPAIHRLTVHDLRASWTTENRDTCLAIADGVQKAYLLRKVLSNDAMKMLQFADPDKLEASARRSAFAERMDQRRGSKATVATDSPVKNTNKSIDEGDEIEGEDMLWKLINEAETNVVAYSEETVEPPANSLLGMALCTTDDVVLTNWQIDLLNSQLVLKGHETNGFILVSAARASITQRFHVPVWKDSQLLLKRSFTSLLSGMQYFAPLSIGPPAAVTLQPNERSATPDSASVDGVSMKSSSAEPPPPSPLRSFQWLGKDVIEEKDPRGPNDKINNYSSSGEAVGGMVSAAQQKLKTQFQMQRVASRCSCQIFFCYYSDLINMEKFEDFLVPQIVEQTEEALGGGKREDVDCFTLKHNMLEVSTNSAQYQMILDIVNNLVLFVDPKKKMAQERRRRLWFELAKKRRAEIRTTVQMLQKELRELVAIGRALERQSFYLNRQIQLTPDDSNLSATNETLQREIDDHKQHQLALIDELAQTISVFKEKTVDEQTEAHRRWRDTQQTEEDLSAEIARRFEVCFEDCIWRLTEHDGQIAITEVQIRNFLYNRTARVDNSGEHLLEIGTVKVLNLLPNSKYRETLARLPKPESHGGSANTDKTPAIRLICRERAPVGGISVKEHFEVNIVPMQAQITYRFFEKMMAFFFPGRALDRADVVVEEPNADGEPSTSSSLGTPNSASRSLWLSKRFRGAAYNSFRSSKPAQPDKEKAMSGAADEIDKMRERADKNNMFAYIIIPPVPFIVSYKGNKEKNIEDVDRFNLTFPQCEYHDKNWTWLDLALEIKRSYRNILLQQFMKQKILRKNANATAMEPISEEEKKRIVLGTTSQTTVSSKKKGNK